MSAGGFIYEGEVRHRRIAPVLHVFRYRLFMLYVDVDRLAETFRGRWLWSTTSPNLAQWRRSDYLGPADRPLSECVRDMVEERIGRRPAGPVWLLTHFRYFGIAMNPISLYYCYDVGGQLDAVVAEVSNTPWNERHWYVLDVRQTGSSELRVEVAKAFHVSPFLGMDYDYIFALNEPNERLHVHITNRDRQHTAERPIFEASLDMQRRSLSAYGLARVLVCYPWMTLRVLIGIYYQAFRLWWKGAPYFPHPSSVPPRDVTSDACQHAPQADTKLLRDSLVSFHENRP